MSTSSHGVVLSTKNPLRLSSTEEELFAWPSNGKRRSDNRSSSNWRKKNLHSELDGDEEEEKKKNAGRRAEVTCNMRELHALSLAIFRIDAAI